MALSSKTPSWYPHASRQGKLLQVLASQEVEGVSHEIHTIYLHAVRHAYDAVMCSRDRDSNSSREHTAGEVRPAEPVGRGHHALMLVYGCHALAPLIMSDADTPTQNMCVKTASERETCPRAQFLLPPDPVAGQDHQRPFLQSRPCR